MAVHGAVKRRSTKGRFEVRDALLLAASLPTVGLTYLLVTWSRVAEPHWPAVGYLPLFPLAAGFVASSEPRAGSLTKCAVGFGAVVFVALHLLVLTPLAPMLVPDTVYEPKYDLANELRGWPEVADAVRALNPDGKPVIAAFYTQCSQLTFQLSRPGDPQVRCVSEGVDDFDLWHGSFSLPKEGAIFVTDNRFDHQIDELVPNAEPRGRVIVSIERARRPVRRFEIIELRPDAY